MKIKTSELIGPALDWAVAKCEGVLFPRSIPKYTTDWSQGGPIIGKEGITIRTNACASGHWAAFIDFGGSNTNIKARQSGPTPLIAAMRCYVASKLGDEVEVPNELIKEI